MVIHHTISTSILSSCQNQMQKLGLPEEFRIKTTHHAYGTGATSSTTAVAKGYVSPAVGQAVGIPQQLPMSAAHTSDILSILNHLEDCVTAVEAHQHSCWLEPLQHAQKLIELHNDNLPRHSKLCCMCLMAQCWCSISPSGKTVAQLYHAVLLSSSYLMCLMLFRALSLPACLAQLKLAALEGCENNIGSACPQYVDQCDGCRCPFVANSL